jgi:hypothetical protein
MSRRYWIITAAVTAVLVAAGLLVRNELEARRERRARAGESKVRRAAVKDRYAFYDMLQPVALSNCRLERFGEPHDGGYLMCANLLDGIQAAYSYGISGYDKWGCDVASRFNVATHQYDCFNLTRPACPGGTTVFHAECVAGTARSEDGRAFDTIASQMAKNGDAGKRIALKIDVEGAEWESLLALPDDVLQRIDQLVVEFHWKHDGHRKWYPPDKYIALVQRLKQSFEVGHMHFNNAACVEGLEPFPTWAYEVLFVNKRLAVVDSSRTAGGLHPADAPNYPDRPDCQPARAGVGQR